MCNKLDCRRQHNKQDTRQLCFDVPQPLIHSHSFLIYFISILFTVINKVHSIIRHERPEGK